MSYWEKTGRYSKLAGELHKKLPRSGPGSPELEEFRIVSGEYYSLNNDGASRFDDEMEAIAAKYDVKEMVAFYAAIKKAADAADEDGYWEMPPIPLVPLENLVDRVIESTATALGLDALEVGGK